MTNMKHNTFKNTNIIWSPEAPIDWDIKKGKFLFRNKKDINEKMQCKDRLALTLKGVIDRFEGDRIGLNPNDLRTYQIFNENDLVFKLIDLDNKKTSRVGYVHKKGIMSSAYIRVIGNKKFNMRYFYYQYFDLYQRFVFNMIGQGVRSTMSPSDLLNIPVLIPPLETQNAIVDYLDRKITQIQEFIRKKERLIELFEESRQNKILELITGSNKNVEFKSSGIEIIDTIPKHWLIKNLSLISKVVLGKMLCNENKGNYKHEHYLKSKNIGWEKVIIDEVDKMWFSKTELINYRIKQNDLLVSEGGEVGKTCIWNNELEECYIQNSVHKITFNKEYNPLFYLYYFLVLGNAGFFKSIVNQVSIAHLTREKLVKIKCIAPPINEQNEIVRQIVSLTTTINTAISKARNEIEKIKEYQESLITNVVTGKIKAPDTITTQ